MNVADTLRGFLRRWYIVLPGIIVAMATALGAYSFVQPGYERTATQLLLPGEGTVPPGVTNPFLYLGGLTQAADIVVQVMKSNEVVGPVVDEYPGTEVVVQRNPTVSGPVIQIIVTATSDAAAEGALTALVGQTTTVLDSLQSDQKVTSDDMMSVSTLTQDTQSALQQKSRLVISAGVALALVVLTLLLASLVDGLSRRARRAGRQGTPVAEAEADEDAEDDVDDVDSTLSIEDLPEVEEVPVEEFSSSERSDITALIDDEGRDQDETTVGSSTRGRGARSPATRRG